MIISSYVPKIGGMGLGDFLRGSLGVYQMCHRYNITAEIDFSQHDIGQYLKPSHKFDISNFSMIDARNVGDYSTNALRNLIARNYRFSYLARNLNNIQVYTNVFPKFPISHEIKQLVRQALIPTDQLQDILPIYEYEYEVIHIRSGDLLAFNKGYDHTVSLSKKDLLKAITDKIKNIVSITTCPVLILSDSMELKTLLTKKCNTVMTETIPSHVSHENSDVVDNLMDYFTLVKARKIHQFSIHAWGSGFSDTVNWIFDVPIEKYPIVHPS